MGDKPENFGRPVATATSTPGVPMAADRATLQTKPHKRRFRENTQTPKGDVIAAMMTGTTTVVLRGRTKVKTNGALSISSTTAPALPPVQWTSEDGTSTFNKNEPSTIAHDAPGELDLAAYPLGELATRAGLLLGTAVGRGPLPSHRGQRDDLVLLRRHRRCQRGEADLFRLPDGRSLRPGCSGPPRTVRRLGRLSVLKRPDPGAQATSRPAAQEPTGPIDNTADNRLERSGAHP